MATKRATSSAVLRPRSSMKSAVMASMFTGTSFRACLVRVAESVSLADQPVSRSVESTKGESCTTSSPLVAGAAAPARAAGSRASHRARRDGRREAGGSSIPYASPKRARGQARGPGGAVPRGGLGRSIRDGHKRRKRASGADRA